MKHVPVLSANNYSFGGETSVFDRELKNEKKSSFEVKKKNTVPAFEHTDNCVVCGEGGSLVCCPRCPNTVHLKCVGLTDPKKFHSCPHHHCVKCSKKRQHAGGLLFPCHACPNAFCEECLPKEGITFLEKNESLDKLGFNASKQVVYINCSPFCEKYAVAELNYCPLAPKLRAPCPDAIDLTEHFGKSYELKEAMDTVHDSREEGIANAGRGKREVGTKDDKDSRNKSQKTPKDTEKSNVSVEAKNACYSSAPMVPSAVL